MDLSTFVAPTCEASGNSLCCQESSSNCSQSDPDAKAVCGSPCSNVLDYTLALRLKKAAFNEYHPMCNKPEHTLLASSQGGIKQIEQYLKPGSSRISAGSQFALAVCLEFHVCGFSAQFVAWCGLWHVLES
jgi:hypothetical protein